jgi:elongation factor Ts
MSDTPTIAAADVKRLRDLTGAGMMDCKKALAEAGGDVERAQEILRTKGLASAAKRGGRTASEGLVDAYIHPGGRVGVLVEVNCETDFVARTEEFRALPREIAMQVAAANPRWVSREDVPDDVVASERKIAEERARSMGKPEHVLDRIVEGIVTSFFQETVLLEQTYIRDDSKTIGDLVTEVASKVGENVIVRRFVRFQLGEEA